LPEGIIAVVSLIVSKIIQAVVVLLGAATVIFIVLRLSGDPAAMLLPPQASEQEQIALREQLGLNKSLAEQYVIYIGNVFVGDFGTSFMSQQPALSLALDRLPYTIALAAATLALVICFAIPLGLAAGASPGSVTDRTVVVVCATGQAIPVFVTGTFLILFFSVYLKWLPSSGARGPESIILPMVTLGLYTMGRTTRLVRAGVMTTLRENFIRAARAKGVSETKILLVHVLKNVLIPVMTMLGLEAGGLFGRAVIVEVVFAWPGLGRLIVDAVLSRDYAVAQAGIMMLAFIYTVLNMVVDILYQFADPRLRTA
jgi:peptide/nickel transport system permease protein